MDRQELSRQVMQRRKELGLSQTELAEKTGISRNYISLIERGEASNISMKILNLLAGALGVSPSTLTGEPGVYDTVIPPPLREFGIEAGLSFETVDALARIPRRGHEPKSVEEWRELYRAIRPYLEESEESED